MNKQDFRFVEIVRDNITSRGNIQELPNGITNKDLDYYGKEVENGFHSIFMHTKDFQEYVNSFGNIRGYCGNVYSECFHWDMDHESIEQAQKDTIELIERIVPFSENYRIFFSGNKGFHVTLFSPDLEKFINEKDFNNIIKYTCSYLAEDLLSFDTKIYDKTRIIRTLNSKHGLTKLYKIELTYEELKTLSIKEIQELAKQQRQIFKTVDNKKDKNLLKIIIEANNKKQSVNVKGTFNASEILNGIVYGFPEGERNSAFTSIAGMLHARNIDDNFIKAILYSINNNNEIKLPEREIETIVNSISKYPIDEQYSDPLSSDIIGIKEAGESWFNIIKNSGYTSFGERFYHLNERMKLCIPGDVISILANSGVGKTTLGLELGNEEAKTKDSYSLFASLEMSRSGIFFRTATIESPDLSIDGYISPSSVAKKLLEEESLKEKVYSNWANLKIIDKGGLSLDRVVEYFVIAQDLLDKKISNLVIDYAQNLNKAEDITYAMGMARKFKEVAKFLNTKLFVLMQCNKTMPDDYTEVLKNHAEGAGAYYQATDYFITAWKSKSHKNRLHVKMLKERWGDTNFKFDLVREGLKYHSEDYLEEEYGSFGL
jgi:hypothetical protein